MPRLDRAGVGLYYEEAGSGTPPLLLVHGWCCDHTYLAPQFAHFQRAHRVVTVDLRGHGQSDKPEQEYTRAAFTDDLIWLSGQLGLDRPVVVGHSLGGAIALDLAVRYPDLVAAIVLLDAPIAPPRANWPARQRLVEELHSPRYLAAATRYVADGMFLPTDDPDRKAKIVAGMTAAPRHVLVSSFENIVRYDTEAAAAALRVPVLSIVCSQPRSDLVRFRELCPHLVQGQTVGAGHFLQLEVPDQVNAMIERFLAISLP